MTQNYARKLENVIEIDEERIQEHLREVVRGTVKEALNGLLDAEADHLCNAAQYEVSVLVTIGVSKDGHRRC